MMGQNEEKACQGHLDPVNPFITRHRTTGLVRRSDDRASLELSGHITKQLIHQFTNAGLSFSGSVAIIAGMMFHRGNRR